MRIAVDAMGGDRAPAEVVSGAVAAAGRFDDIQVILAGIPDQIEPFLGEDAPSNIEIAPASEIVAMTEPPVEAIKRKKDSSLRRVFELVAAGKADAAVSAGNTGATVAAASMLVGPLDGCRRPGIAARFPGRKGYTVVIDVGANIAPKPLHLLQYAIMAQIFARETLRIAAPRVGLLSVGEEREKGTDLVRTTHELLEKYVADFAGNCEGRDIYEGTVDVVVCDGFTGNVVLKATEGYAAYLTTTLISNISESVPAGHQKLKSFIIDFVANNDYREYGGAPLLGVKAPVIISHGSSNSTAISNAVMVARDFGRRDVNRLIVEALRDVDSVSNGEDA